MIMIINEDGWNESDYENHSMHLMMSFLYRTSHNYVFNPDSPYIGMKEDLDN